MKFRGIEKAVSKFNEWPATARIFLDKANGNVSCETFVKPHEGRFDSSRKKSVVEVRCKETLYGENIHTSVSEIKSFCSLEMLEAERKS